MRRLSFVFLLSFGAGLGTASAQEKLMVNPNQPFYIQSVYSGEVLQAANGATAPGTRLWQWSNTAATSEQFKFVPQSNGSYEIVGVASGLCVDLYSNNPNNGTIIQLWNCYGGTAQQWFLEPVSGAQFFLVNAGTGSCINVSGPTTTQGALTQEWSCWSGSLNELYTITPVTKKTSNSAGLHVSGNQLLNGKGAVVQLKGLNIPSLEWGNGEPNAYSTPPPCQSGQTIMNSVTEALGYGANFVRIPINQDRWWNEVDGQAATYRSTLDLMVQTITNAGAYVLIDLHTSDAGVWGQNITQHEMPDLNTQTVLADLAAHYGGNPSVMFGLYNEPYNVSWSVWLNGGSVTEGSLTYTTPGMQAMVNTVRNAGASNVVVAGGLNWAFDLTGITSGYALADNNVVYDAHVYPLKGAASTWDTYVTVAASKYPILIGEFGANSSNLGPFSSPQSFLSTLQPWLTSHKYHYSAWDLHPTSTPSMISDWCFTQTSYFGAIVIPWL